MYDLETLRRLNEEACLAAVALASSDKPPSLQAEERTKDAGPPPVFPLSVLARKLKGGQFFLPYLTNVYKATYPGTDCIEETVACVWQWDNTIIRSPASLRDFWRRIIQSCPFDAYRNGGKLDSEDVRPVEDRLLAQSNLCAIHPNPVPVIWGTLPRPYVQPWTRYENIDFMMTRSAGGRLASQLNASPLRKTIQIYHV